MPNYEVIVSNIGRVYDGSNKKEATARYNYYVRLSRTAKGSRGYNEQVSLWTDGEVTTEHFPPAEPERLGTPKLTCSTPRPVGKPIKTQGFSRREFLLGYVENHYAGLIETRMKYENGCYLIWSYDWEEQKRIVNTTGIRLLSAARREYKKQCVAARTLWACRELTRFKNRLQNGD